MTTYSSANHRDPTLYCQYFGGPQDGFKTGDLPAFLSGEKLTGMVAKTPLWQPHETADFAVYVCTSETQIDGFWRFDYVGIEGPGGGARAVESGHDCADPLTQLRDIARSISDSPSARIEEGHAS